MGGWVGANIEAVRICKVCSLANEGGTIVHTSLIRAFTCQGECVCWERRGLAGGFASTAPPLSSIGERSLAGADSCSKILLSCGGLRESALGEILEVGRQATIMGCRGCVE